MVKCPQCKSELVRYSFRTRQTGTHILVECEVCGYGGPEIKVASMSDTSAALTAARAFDTGSLQNARSTRVFLITERHRLQ